METAPLLPELIFEISGRTEVAGRAAIAVRARPHVSERDLHGPSGLHGIGMGADEYELAVDTERGILLRAVARLDGEPFRVLEAREVAFDEDLPVETFVLKLPPGQSFQAPIDDREVPLDHVQALVGFAVLVPEHPPVATDPDEPFEGAEQAVIMPPAPRWNMPELVHIAYQLGRRRVLTLRESAEPLPVREHQVLERRGDLLVGEDREPGPARINVRMQRLGTHVELEGMGMGVDELVALAGTLVTLPRHHP